MLDKFSVTKNLIVPTVDAHTHMCSSAFVLVWPLAGFDESICVFGRIIAEYRNSLGALQTCKICLLLHRKGESWCYDVAAKLPEPLESPGWRLCRKI